MRRNALTVSMMLALMAGFSCTKPEAQTAFPAEGADVTGVRMEVPPVLFDDDTRATMEAGESGLSFFWSADDAVGVHTTAGGFARFALQSGAGTASALFDGQGFDLREGETYYAFFPYEMSASDRTAVPLRYDGQTVSGSDDRSALLSRDYLYASGQPDGSGKVGFDFRHAGAFLRMTLSLPAGTPVDRVELLPTYDEIPTSLTLDLSKDAPSVVSTAVSLNIGAEGTVVPESGELVVWAAMPPRSFTAASFAVLVHSGADVFTLHHKGSAFQAGKAYRWAGRPLQLGEAGAWGFSGVTEKPAFQATVTAGQYSGISWIGGNRYAVVHDKLKGGGIVFYEIDLGDTGSVTSVSMTIPSGTESSTVASQDNEGVAYVPETGTLFVCSEKNQRIQEYDMDGNPTGRKMTIPADMAKSLTTKNQGFESLTFNAETGLFWTTTEHVLKKETSLPRLLRLQSFGLDLKPAARFFYQMDAPAKSAEEAAAAKSYVHGVPALAALDDGRLLVLEREVYVPNGGMFDMLLNSFGNAKIYVVNPSEDTAGVLRKNLVASFSTNSGTLANYEGMCLGPTLPDGSRCLVLVPDSQGGQNGLTKEYVKVITVRP